MDLIPFSHFWIFVPMSLLESQFVLFCGRSCTIKAHAEHVLDAMYVDPCTVCDDPVCLRMVELFRRAHWQLDAH